MFSLDLWFIIIILLLIAYCVKWPMRRDCGSGNVGSCWLLEAEVSLLFTARLAAAAISSGVCRLVCLFKWSDREKARLHT